jgi:uncharacterized protein (DUF2236 family)
MHGRVRGKLHYDGGPRYPKGTPFAGTDQSLLLWVLYGAFESFELAYDTFVRRLTAEEKEAHWPQWRLAARLFGVRDDDDLPRTRAEVDAYGREMLGTDRTFVTDPARKRTVPFVMTGRDAVENGREAPSRVPWFARPGFEVVKSFTLTTLPDRIRQQYGFPAPAARGVVTTGAGALSRRVSPALTRVRKWPEAYGKAAPWEDLKVKVRPDGSRAFAD